MKHPSHEQWMSYLYDELPTEQHRELSEHLGSCAECRAQVEGWRSTMQQLDAWKVEAAPSAPPAPRFAAWKWAAAAAVLIGVGFGFGRFAAPPVDTAALTAQIEKSVGAHYERQLADLKQTFQATRETDREALVGILKQMEAKRATDYEQLRSDLETVAVVAENKLQLTQQQIGLLASNSGTGSASPQ